MGLLDDLKHKAEELGEAAKEGLDTARDKAGDLVDDVRDRLGHHGESAPLSESSDVAPDAAEAGSAAATGAGADADVVSADDLDADLASDAGDEPDGATGAVEPSAEDAADEAADEPEVESDVDPYDEPLSETIGDEIASDRIDREAVADAVDTSDRSDQA